MVDWSLARQIARFAAGSDGVPDLGVDLAALVSEMEPHVARETGLELGSPVPPPELLGRGDWAAMNLEALAGLLDPVAERLDRRMGSAGPLAPALRAGASATLAAEAGLVFGYVSQRVLGQYELSLLQAGTSPGAGAPPRLVFVAPNLERAVDELGVDGDSFYGWIAIHELTHVFQFQGVSWLRDHVAGLVREYLRTVEVRIESGAAGGIPALPDLSRLVEAFREGGLAALVQTHEQRDVMDRIQATMAVIEGYSEHVMDALGARLLPGWDGLREAMERRRRNRSAPERILERLLGLNLKLRQYELGRAFCSGVAEREGMEALNAVWDSPKAMPTTSELDRPAAWLARVRPSSPAPA
ncbi:MAG: zinc-dependent metalloprotease [Thermoleophilaceae bacterium]